MTKKTPEEQRAEALEEVSVILEPDRQVLEEQATQSAHAQARIVSAFYNALLDNSPNLTPGQAIEMTLAWMKKWGIGG